MSKNGIIVMKKKGSIYIDTWLRLKPYDSHTNVDTYYLKVCNQVRDVVSPIPCVHELTSFGDKDDFLDILSCFLTSYLEDLVSETNHWNTFVRLFKKKYNKPLPFFDTKSDDYFEEEINIQDIQFLLYYFLSVEFPANIINPYDYFILEVSKKVMEIFEEAWEVCPENTRLKSYFEIEENETDFYQGRILVDKLLRKSYLLYPDSAEYFKYEIDTVIDELDDEEWVYSQITEALDTFLHNYRTKLLGLSGREWAAEIVDDDHPIKSLYLGQSDKITAIFLVVKKSSHYLYLKHIATQRIFDVALSCIDDPSIYIRGIVYSIGLVKWDNEWLMSGVATSLENGEERITRERDLIKNHSYAYYLGREATHETTLNQHLQIFKEETGGHQIKFIAYTEISDFIDDFENSINTSFTRGRKKKKESNILAKLKRLHKTTLKPLRSHESEEDALIFFNPKAGIEIVYNTNGIFPDEENNAFDKDIDDDSLKEGFISLLVDKSYSTELTLHYIHHYADKIPFLSTDEGKIYLQEIDFLLRFYKQENYIPKPMLFHDIT